jgi:hypothetical protein
MLPKLKVEELLQNQHLSFQGAALQTYAVPGMSQQKRLYVTAYRGLPSADLYKPIGGAGEGKNKNKVFVVRINLNRLEANVTTNKGPIIVPLPRLGDTQNNRKLHTYVDGCPEVCTQSLEQKPKGCSLNFCWNAAEMDENLNLQRFLEPDYPGVLCPTSSHGGHLHGRLPRLKGDWDRCKEGRDKWGEIAKPVLETQWQLARPTRLAFADGKLYHMSTTVGQRSQLRSTDATLVIDCGAVWNATNQSFVDWEISEANYGKAMEAPGTRTELGDVHYENLTEISALGAKLPWQFQAFKKVVRSKNETIAKEMLCSRPRMPTTRPTKESCCVRKRVLGKVLAASGSTAGFSTCTTEELTKQL